MFFSDFHCKENDGTTGAAHFIQLFFFCEKPEFCGLLRSLLSLYQKISQRKSKSNALLQSSIHLNAACHHMTLLAGEKKFAYAYEGSRSPYASALH